MKNKLCSENFISFFNDIEKVGLTIDEIAGVISGSIPKIASDIFLGKLSCCFFVPPSPTEKAGRTTDFEFYSNAADSGENGVTFEYPTGEGGKVTFIACPVKGYFWNDAEKAQIEFLCRNIYVICGRSRLMDIMGKSLSRDRGTGLPNASGFIAAGNRLLCMGKLQDYSAMYLNLKNFRFVNAKVGNKYGDFIIKAYADALTGKLKSDEVAARLGGDNFTLLVKKERADEMLAFLSGVPVAAEIGGVKFPFNISARVGVYNVEPTDSMSQVMDCISAAISAARRNAIGDVVVFDHTIVNKIAREQEITTDFRRALENREFIVYYQPKVDLKTNEMCGCEALVRWKKAGKLVPPGEFIPIFERDGNICALDFYMLDNVCRNISEWIKDGLEPVTVSVNFSKTHLHNPNIAEDILAIINKYGIESKYIEIELTEMSDYSDYGAFKTLVTKMKNNGVLTSIDDFGTGYSSLNLLTDFMFDIVKLDKSFLDNIIRNNSKTDEIVVRNMIKMIKELNMKAIAEGVETPEQARFLKDIDCNMVQGFLFDKPLAVEDFVKRLKKKKYEEIVGESVI